ncbi:MAG: helix-turn-helix transcriptional regulator [Andreesenia angusta]|nr:helix-turn-helix transcriptional regulator [Andreesenia angusta]
MEKIKFTNRQKSIMKIVKENPPITGEEIAKKLNLTRATLRPDLTVLTMIGILEARPKVGYFYTGNISDDIKMEQIISLKVSEVKSIPVVVNINTSVSDTIVKMFLENVGSIYIVSDKSYLLGLVSRKDLLKAAIGGLDLDRLPIGVLMTRMPNIITVTPNESVIDAANKIINHEVDSLPIVEIVETDGKKNYKVIGKISKTVIVSVFVDMYNRYLGG